LLGGLATYFFRETAQQPVVMPNFRVGRYYAMGSIALLIAAMATTPAGLFFLWPALSLGIVAFGYFRLGASIFRKEDGRLPWSTRIALAPVLLGQHLSLVYYRRQCRAWDTVVPGVLIGRLLSDAEAARAVQQGVAAVLDLTGEFTEATPFCAVNYRNIPVLDLTAPTQEQLSEAVTVMAREIKNGTVYVHCKIGYSRSAAVVGAFLLATGRAATAQDAIAMLRAVRPTLVVREEAVKALHQFESDAVSVLQTV
jgi:protein-tyrosine phosphatase